MRTILAALVTVGLVGGFVGTTDTWAARLQQQTTEDDAPPATTANENQTNDEDTPATTPKSDTVNRLSGAAGAEAGPAKGRDNVLRMRTQR